MSEQEIIEGNKLIAEFMRVFTDDSQWPYHVHGDSWKLEGLKYHKSWDWLMPVVGKIHLKKEVRDVVVTPGATAIILHEGYPSMFSPCRSENTSIIECWLVVIEFVKWCREKKNERDIETSECITKLDDTTYCLEWKHSKKAEKGDSEIKAPLDRVVNTVSDHYCENCHSTTSRVGFMGMKRVCDNKECKCGKK